MVSPVYVVESWLGVVLHLCQEAPILDLLFAAVLLLEPAILLGLAAWITRTWAGVKQPWLRLIVRYSYSLAPLGFGMWLAHYGYHFFAGLYTIVPVTQSALADLSWQILGEPGWTLVGLPQAFVQPIEFGFLLLGLTGSLMIIWQLARQDSEHYPLRVFMPWGTVCLLLFAASLWLMTQPMDMRATIMAG